MTTFPSLPPLTRLAKAREDFQRARKRAALQQILASLTGQSVQLLPFEPVRQQLKFTGSAPGGRQTIRIHDIVGSVGRPQDFTRSFLPVNPSDEMRWANLKAYILDGGVPPPIEVYKLGDAYFVSDGNHRVSIARELHHESIEAYVTEIRTRVPLSHHDQPEILICKARYAEFLEQTNLDEIRPGSNLLLTFCDQYDLLLSQIEVQRFFLWRDRQVELDNPQVVAAWYDQVYLPVVELLRRQGTLAEFPERTEGDLYILLSEHRLELEKQLGEAVSEEQAAGSLYPRRSLWGLLRRIFAQMGKRLT